LLESLAAFRGDDRSRTEPIDASVQPSATAI